MSMPLDPVWLDAFTQVFSRCRIGTDEETKGNIATVVAGSRILLGARGLEVNRSKRCQVLTRPLLVLETSSGFGVLLVPCSLCKSPAFELRCLEYKIAEAAEAAPLFSTPFVAVPTGETLAEVEIGKQLAAHGPGPYTFQHLTVAGAPADVGGAQLRPGDLYIEGMEPPVDIRELRRANLAQARLHCSMCKHRNVHAVVVIDRYTNCTVCTFRRRLLERSGY